jgi:protein-disulfide isomerase
MKSGVFMAFAIALVAIAGCNSKQGDAAPHAPARLKQAGAPRGGDWTTVVSPTPAGGFVMGNPKAKVKLVEYGSMTCPHCAHFDETGVPMLVGKYVKSGQVSWEFRNYVRDAFDVSASMVARCNGAKSFFPLTREIFKEQKGWEAKIEAAPEDQLKATQDLPPNQEFAALAKVAGFQELAAAHGIPVARTSQCLSNANTVDQLVKIGSDANAQFPDFPGTPTFLINGVMVDLGPITEDQVWSALEAKINAAASGRH